MSDTAGQLYSAIGRAVVGQSEAIEQVLVALLAGGHVLLEGAPGLGKTLLVLSMARAVGGCFSRIQFTPDLMPADVTGHTLYDPASGKFTVRRGPVFCNFLLADEINRAPAKTQSALLEVMAEQQVTIEGTSHVLQAPFMALATQNPIEQEGTYPLPEAQLDRFLLKVVMDYPSADDEAAIVTAVTRGRVGARLDATAVAQVMRPQDVVDLQTSVAAIEVAPSVVEYAVRLVRATRTEGGLMVGAGPRGAIALVRAGRARAVLHGRDFLTPDDIKAIALPALRHRIILAPELEIEGVRADDVLTRILSTVDAPRQ